MTALLGRAVSGVTPLGGAYRVRLADGTDVVAKRHDTRSGVLAEVAGLRWLRDAAAGPPISGATGSTDNSGGSEAGLSTAGPSTQDPSGGPPISSPAAGTDSSGVREVGCPQVLAHDSEWLVVEAVPAGQPGVAAAERLGRGLAALHRSGAAAFGAPPPGGPVDAWIGLAPMRNATGETWPEWYAEHRLLPYLRTADLPDRRAVDTVCERIADLAGPAEPPARLHGDLWNGNVLWAADGRAWLVDPAAHGGHRETDLAMLALFGCPHLDRVLAAYDEVSPLADGWRARIPLHQLFPLLVHTVLFGGGYGAQADRAARAALRGL